VVVGGVVTFLPCGWKDQLTTPSGAGVNVGVGLDVGVGAGGAGVEVGSTIIVGPAWGGGGALFHKKDRSGISTNSSAPPTKTGRIFFTEFFVIPFIIFLLEPGAAHGLFGSATNCQYGFQRKGV
jgi:hypothetical protein